jgi:hypothetical protein
MTADRHPTRVRLRWAAALTSLAVFLLTAAAGPAEADTPSKSEVRRIVIEEARANPSVPVSLALAVARVESNFQADALSSAGARGVMQIMPATGRGVFGVHPDELWDARTNVNLGVRYLEQLYEQYGRRWELALSHYNGGTLKGRGAYAIPHDYTRGYVRKVMAFNTQYAREVTGTQLAAADQDRRTRQAQSRGRAAGTNLADHPTDYWVFADPHTDKNWRSYLDAADYWLASPEEQAKRRAERERSDARTPRAYPPVHAQSIYRPWQARTFGTRKGGDAGTGAYQPVDGQPVNRFERVSPRARDLRERFFERLHSGQLG